MSTENSNQEADHWANVATEGNRKIVMDSRDATTTWKAIRGFWVGSFKNNGRNECGIVIKGVDRQKWVTKSKTAVPLKVGAAMAAEIAGLCLLTSILDLILCKFGTREEEDQKKAADRAVRERAFH